MPTYLTGWKQARKSPHEFGRNDKGLKKPDPNSERSKKNMRNMLRTKSKRTTQEKPIPIRLETGVKTLNILGSLNNQIRVLYGATKIPLRGDIGLFPPRDSRAIL